MGVWCGVWYSPPDPIAGAQTGSTGKVARYKKNATSVACRHGMRAGMAHVVEGTVQVAKGIAAYAPPVPECRAHRQLPLAPVEDPRGERARRTG